MEASDTSGQDPAPYPTQDSGQPDANSQEQPAADSNLTTPQPDQPVQSEPERQDAGPSGEPAQASAGPSGEPAEGTVREAPRGAPVSNVPDAAAETVEQEQQREAARQEHNERTGGGEIQSNEVQNARQEHNDRTGGGSVPGADSADNGPIDRGE